MSARVAHAADQDVHALNGTEGYAAERRSTAEKREVTGSTPVPATTKALVTAFCGTGASPRHDRRATPVPHRATFFAVSAGVGECRAVPCRRSRDAAVTRMRELCAPSRCRIARRCEVASRAARGRRVGVEHELLQQRVVGHDQRDDAEREHPERVTFVSALARTMLGALCPLVRSTRWKGLEANVRIRRAIKGMAADAARDREIP